MDTGVRFLRCQSLEARPRLQVHQRCPMYHTMLSPAPSGSHTATRVMWSSDWQSALALPLEASGRDKQVVVLKPVSGRKGILVSIFCWMKNCFKIYS